MAFKLRASAAVFAPMNNTMEARSQWLEMESLTESISDLQHQIQLTNACIKQLQRETLTFFTLTHSYNAVSLDEVSRQKENLNYLSDLYVSLTNHLFQIKKSFQSKYPRYRHQCIPTQILCEETRMSPSRKHDLLICGYVRAKCISTKISLDVINIIKSFVTHFSEYDFVWSVVEETENSQIFYCNDIAFYLCLDTAKKRKLRLKIESIVDNISWIRISTDLYTNHAAIYRAQKTAKYKRGGKSLDVYLKLYNDMTPNMGCNVRILSIGYQDGCVQHLKDIMMKRNFTYDYKMSNVLTADILKSVEIGRVWGLKRFDDGNWCITIAKHLFDGRAQIGLTLLQLPSNVSKIGVKWSTEINGENEVSLSYFDYDCTEAFGLKKFTLHRNDTNIIHVCIRILTVFDLNDEYVSGSEWHNFGIVE